MPCWQPNEESNMAVVIAAIGRLCFERIRVKMAGSRRQVAGGHWAAPGKIPGRQAVRATRCRILPAASRRGQRGDGSGCPEFHGEWISSLPGPGAEDRRTVADWQHYVTGVRPTNPAWLDTGASRSLRGTPPHRGRGGMRKILSFLLVLVFGAVPSWASLGLSEQSVHADQQRMAGQLKSATF